MLGDIISGIGSAVGGYISGQASERNAERNIAMQREFAQNGLRWKVEDAKAAGVHPLAALGASTHSFAPVSVGSSGLGNALASMGQGVGRAVNATSTSSERVSAFTTEAAKLQLDNMSLQNQMLRSKLALVNQSGGNPPFPSSDSDTTGPQPAIPEEKKDKDRPRLRIGGQPWHTDPQTSNAEEFETRYGDDGPASWVAGLAVGSQDLVRNYGSPDTWPKSIWWQAWDHLSSDAKREWGNLERFVRGVKSASHTWMVNNADRR